MKNNNINENNCVYMCAKNEDVDKINLKYFEQNTNESFLFKRQITYYNNKIKIDKIEGHDNLIKETMKRGNDIYLKVDMKVMITENIDVPNGVYNGMCGLITKIEVDIISVITDNNKLIEISYYVSETNINKIKSDDHYTIINKYIPLKQCNAITIHKCQGMTLNYCILNCDGIFTKSMFYTALSRIINPENMKIINFKESYIKCCLSAFEYETENKYISYFEKMLIDNDEDKLNKLKIKSKYNILEDNTIFYDFECATKGNEGHKPYFNHMIKLYNGVIDDQKTFCHYNNSIDVNKDTFEYIMKIVIYQCDKYLEGMEENNKALKKTFRKPLYLCGFNNAQYDLYFFTNLLLKSKYAQRFTSKTIFKNGALIFFMLVDNKTGKQALKSHDLYQILLCSLDNACKSYLNKDVKGIFPHKLINNIFFKDNDILNKSFNLVKDDFYKRDHDKLNNEDLNNYNIGEKLFEYAKNDTLITYELYKTINNLCHEILNTDILRMLTVGMMCNYGMMLNLPDECLFKTKNGNKKQDELNTRLYLCDTKENDMISQSVSGGRTLPRIHAYISDDHGNNYNDINDYLVMLDISGMYAYIMHVCDFPYDKSRYVNKQELDNYNMLIKNKKYDELMKILPEFYICECDCQPNIYDLEVPIGRHEDKRLFWDCKRRTSCYNSIDIKTLLKNRGDIFEIKKMLIWDKSAKIFEKWIKQTLTLKEKGEKMSKDNKDNSGAPLRQFAKLLANGAYGQTIKKDHDSNIAFINSITEKDKYLDENVLDDIIFNDDNNDDSYHVFIGKKISDENKDLTSRSRFLGSFVLSYSRQMLDNIVNCIYGENRFKIEGLKQQIYYGDTDSIIIHYSLLDKLIKNGFIGDVNGKLTDDLNKNFMINGFSKITKYCASAPKKICIGIYNTRE